MNAPRERGQEDFAEVQNRVFSDQIEEKNVTDVMAFIIENAPLFRFFAEHLPDDLRAAWENIQSTDESRKLLETHYGAFHDQIHDYIETVLTQVDPETYTALTLAVEEQNIDQVSSILEKCIELYISSLNQTND
jgi:hypothetical protein